MPRHRHSGRRRRRGGEPETALGRSRLGLVARPVHDRLGQIERRPHADRGRGGRAAQGLAGPQAPRRCPRPRTRPSLRRGCELEGSPFRILTKAQPWPRRDPARPRRAALSGFGFGGINAHVLIEEWPARLQRKPGPRSESAPQSSAIASHPAPPARQPRPVAIVGMAAHFGPFADLRAFQEQVFSGETARRAGSTEALVGCRGEWQGSRARSSSPARSRAITWIRSACGLTSFAFPRASSRRCCPSSR